MPKLTLASRQTAEPRCDGRFCWVDCTSFKHSQSPATLLWWLIT